MSKELEYLRNSKGVANKVLVDAIKIKFPGFDKSLLSKVTRSDQYGVTLRREVIDSLVEEFAPDAKERVKRRRDGYHRLTHRIMCRLEESVYIELQQAQIASGHDTMQSYVADILKSHLENERRKGHRHD